MRLQAVAFCLAGALAAVAAPPAPSPIRIQLTTGGHAYDFAFYSIFEGQSDLAITVNPHPSAFCRDMRDEVDVLVLYDLADVTEQSRQENLRKFVEAGKGVVVLHHAIADNQNWRWWNEEVVGGMYLLKAGGGKPASTYKHDIDMKIKPAAAHPVTTGIDAFTINDEAYKQMWISPRARVLLTTDHPLSDGPVAWIGPGEKFRVVYIQLGHGPLGYRNPAYRRLVKQAIYWAAGRGS